MKFVSHNQTLNLPLGHDKTWMKKLSSSQKNFDMTLPHKIDLVCTFQNKLYYQVVIRNREFISKEGCRVYAAKLIL